MKALIVTGSRHGLAVSTDEYTEKLLPFLEGVGLLIHGCAEGVDTIFSKLATEHCIIQLPMEAQWNQHGPVAGPLRNEHMVNVGLALKATGWTVTAAAFPGPNSRGTKNCIKLLKAACIPTTITSIGL